MWCSKTQVVLRICCAVAETVVQLLIIFYLSYLGAIIEVRIRVHTEQQCIKLYVGDLLSGRAYHQFD